jgi:hypothetical protein
MRQLLIFYWHTIRTWPIDDATICKMPSEVKKGDININNTRN